MEEEIIKQQELENLKKNIINNSVNMDRIVKHLSSYQEYENKLFLVIKEERELKEMYMSKLLNQMNENIELTLKLKELEIQLELLRK